MAHVPESEPQPRMGLIEARNERRMSQQELADEIARYSPVCIVGPAPALYRVFGVPPSSIALDL